MEKIVKKAKTQVSDIDRIETDLIDSDEEEKYMPLCQRCLKDWENGKLEAIEKKWINDENRHDYISLD